MIRIGSVPYLNARPLVEGLRGAADVAYREEVPARLARLLETGELDVALVSSVTALAAGAGAIVPAGVIASYGPVESVLLAAREDPDRAASVALDGASLTAATLARIHYAQFLGRDDVRFHGVPPAPRVAGDGATLLIGDAALLLDRAGLAITDLGAAWSRATGLPFVWAVWLAAPGVDAQALAPRLEAARRAGMQALARHAREAEVRLGIAPPRALDYLSRVMRYDLDASARAGLDEFFRRARALPAAVLPRDGFPRRSAALDR